MKPKGDKALSEGQASGAQPQEVPIEHHEHKILSLMGSCQPPAPVHTNALPQRAPPPNTRRVLLLPLPKAALVA